MTIRPGQQPITPEMLAPLAEQHGRRWKIWSSAHGEYACATLRRGLSWVRPEGKNPVGAGGAYVQTLVTDSAQDLQTAMENENENITHLLTDGTLKADG